MTEGRQGKGAHVELDNVDFAYDSRHILRAATLEIDPGSFVGVIGPNGGGKTTLLKLIAGLLRPTHGRIKVTPSGAARPGWKAYVPQRLNFDSDFPISVLEVVLGGCLAWASRFARYSAAQRSAALKALERVNMAPHAHEPFGQLSGGQAQRVLFARALVAEPELLLLDEPTANVDVEAEAQLYELIKGLKGSMTICMVTHHLPMLIDTVDRVLTVQQEISSMPPSEVCDHYGMGLYHRPMREDVE